MIGYNILLVGFSDYEKSTIETFFRLAGKRAPHWRLTQRSNEARVVLLNATLKQDLDRHISSIASWQKVIIVGSSDYGSGWPILPRPIKLTAILTLLDNLIEFKASEIPKSAPSIASPVIVNPNITDVFAGLTSGVSTVAVTAGRSATVVTKVQDAVKVASVPLNEAPSFLASSSAGDQISTSNPINPVTDMRRVLIVDDSDIALKYMQNRLRHFSYECDMVHSGEEALAMVATHTYQFVFLDVMMAGLDGYQTCKAIKNNKARRGPAPVVVMLTSKGGTIDKIRGSMAGCDAYLTKPINDKKLSAALAKFDESTVFQRWRAVNPQLPLTAGESLKNRAI
jgi:two-component system cell cycle response regulator